MPSRYYLRISNPDGTNPQIVTAEQQAPTQPDPTKSGYLDLAFSNVRNDYGQCRFILPGNHAVIPTLVNNAQVEVWRTHLDPASGATVIPWYREWSGRFKDIDSWEYVGSELRFTGVAYQDAFMLQDRDVDYLPLTANRSTFTATVGETIMKTLVDYNACANATVVNGRGEAGAVTGLAIEANGARGTSMDWTVNGENLLDNLKKLWAAGAGGDFSVVKMGTAAWTFYWGTYHLNSAGTPVVAADRTASVVFSLDNGNMSAPKYRKLQSKEKTVALVGIGSGVIRTGLNYDATLNKVEYHTSAPTNATAAGKNAAGDADMKKLIVPEGIDFAVLQTPASLYGLHYWLGDKVTAKFLTITKQLYIQSVAVSFNQGQEVMDIGLSNV